MSKHYVVHHKISPELVKIANENVTTGKLNRHTIEDDGEGKLTGYISEHFMLHIFSTIISGARIEDVADETMDCDIIIDGHKVDVKAKRRTSPMRPEYDVTVPEYTVDKQHCDSYAFCSITYTRDKTTPLEFYFMGMMSKREFLQKARVLKKGQEDGGNILPNGKPFVVKKDCRNLMSSQLKQYDYDTLKPLLRHGYKLIEW